MNLNELKGFILILALFFSLSPSILFADAQVIPNDNKEAFEFSKCPNIDNSTFLIEKNVSCETLNRFLSIHQKLQEISPTAIPLSRVIFNKNRNSFQFVSFSNLIRLNEENNKGQTFEQKNIILIHELAHTIFHNFLTMDFEEFKSLAVMSKKESDQIWNSMNTNPPTIIAFPEIAYFIQPYNELFADFVAAVYTNDLDSTYSAFDKTVGNIDFLKQIKRVSFLNENQDGKCENFQHFYFSFSRPAIAKKFYKHTTNVKEKQKMVLNFYKFISKDMMANWKKYGSQIDCQKANLELIEKIKAQL